MKNMRYRGYHATKRKDKERSIGSGRHFKLDIREWFLMLLVYYRLYITYTLSSFLFELDQSNRCCRDIQKIEPLIRKCVPIPEICYITKRLKMPAEGEIYFPGFLSFISSTVQQIQSRPVSKERITTQERRKGIHAVKNQFMVNNSALVIYKLVHIKGRKNDYDIYKNIRRIIL